MKVNFTYPKIGKKVELKNRIYKTIKNIFLFTAFICPILNIFIGGKAWSLIVLWSIWTFYDQFISLDMIEYNAISQVVKLIFNSSVLLIIIDRFLVGGWAIEAVPIVCFSGIVLVGFLLFFDFNRQKHNTLPMILLCLLCIISSIIGLSLWREETRWALAVMGSFALVLLAAYISKFGISFISEFKKYVSTK